MRISSSWKWRAWDAWNAACGVWWRWLAGVNRAVSVVVRPAWNWDELPEGLPPGWPDPTPERVERSRALSAVALMRGVSVAPLLQAMQFVERGRFVLVGTMALQMRGHGVQAQDIDFLCEHAPGGFEDGKGSGGSSQREVATFKWRGVALVRVTVDFIYADRPRRRFLTALPDVILGVPVASEEDVIGLKRHANREKDRKFLARWEAGGPPPDALDSDAA